MSKQSKTAETRQHEAEVERLLEIAIAKVAHRCTHANVWDDGSSAVEAYVAKALAGGPAVSRTFFTRIEAAVHRAMIAQTRYVARQFEELNWRVPVRKSETSHQEINYPCPRCKGTAKVIGGFNAIEYIRCTACGYSGDHFEEDGVVYDIEDGLDQEAYAHRVNEIASDPANVELAAQTREAGLREWQETMTNDNPPF